MLKHIKLKNIFIFALVFFVISIFLSVMIFADNSHSYDFSNFSEADSVNFVLDHDIEIPEIVVKSGNMASFTREIILRSYNSPTIPFCFNYSKTQKYAEDIRLAVQSYIKSNDIPSTASTTTYTLQYNKVKNNDGYWVTSGGAYKWEWQFYNCYAYSIKRAERPGFYDGGFFQYDPGQMCGEGTFEECSNISELAELVKKDLIIMGFTNVSLSSTIPTISSSEELICVRRNATDYHFMRYDISTDAWYHKPGNTAVLKYNYTPSNNRLWYAENSHMGIERADTTTYTSDIIYIKYSKNQLNVNHGTSLRKYINAGKDIFCEFNISDSEYYDISLNSLYSFVYEIYDENFDVILSGIGTSFNLIELLEPGEYYLRINFESITCLSYIDVQINHHTTHSYDVCTYNDNSSHLQVCLCGHSQTETHYVKRSSIVNNRFAQCLGCKRLLDLFEDTAYIESQPIIKISLNGSYILNNGIIVLVDADIEQFMNGTLKFYNVNSAPITE